MIILLEIEKQIHVLPEELNNLKGKVQEAKNLTDSKKGQLKDLLVNRKKIELELEGKLSNINKLDSQMMMVKTNIEYKALEKEIFGLKSDCSVIEDRILENMEQAENIEKEIGLARGSSWDFSILGIMNEKADYDSAIQDAIQKHETAGANALIKLSWMEERFNGIFFSVRQMKVTGTAVKISDKAKKK